MNYGELRSQFLELLNRTDCTDSLADAFISMGLRRVERLLRTPLQRTTFSFTIGSTWAGSVPIPADYIGLHEIRVDGIPIRRVASNQQDILSGFWIEGFDFKFTDGLTEGQVISVTYYSEFSQGVPDITVTTYSLVLNDVIIYAALFYAGDHFIDARKDAWGSTMKELVAEVQLMADMDEVAGGGMVITPYGGGVI